MSLKIQHSSLKDYIHSNSVENSCLDLMKSSSSSSEMENQMRTHNTTGSLWKMQWYQKLIFQRRDSHKKIQFIGKNYFADQKERKRKKSSENFSYFSLIFLYFLLGLNRILYIFFLFISLFRLYLRLRTLGARFMNLQTHKYY